MRRLTHVIIMAAFVFSLGGHWYLLQGVAWVNMVREYSQVVPFPEAVGMALSGQYPCELCKAIAEHKNSDQQKAFTFDKYDKKFPLPSEMVIYRSAACAFPFPPFASPLQFRSEVPPTPPPRGELS